VLAAVLLLLGPASVVSAGGEKSRGDAVDLLSAVPADARLVVAIDDLQRGGLRTPILLRFSGRGKVWVQSRCPHAFASWVHPYRPKKQKSNN
jgi:hypothetical protein